MFGQTFETHDLAIIGVLIVLEGVLSIDNALVLGILARRLPPEQRARALSYGLIGAVVFRLIAVSLSTVLLKTLVARLIGGLYLLYIAIKHFLTAPEKPPELNPDGTFKIDENKVRIKHASFWSTVIVIELTDVAFAVDSILAAVGLVNNTQKVWVVFAGGILGVILMRFAAAMFVKMLDKFPRFETAAYLLVIMIGLKLVIEYFFNPDPQHPRLDFHSPTSIAFGVFWGAMLACFCVGFIPHKVKSPPASRV